MHAIIHGIGPLPVVDVASGEDERLYPPGEGQARFRGHLVGSPIDSDYAVYRRADGSQYAVRSSGGLYDGPGPVCPTNERSLT